MKTDSNTYILRTYDGKAKKINNLNTPEVLGYMGNVDSISVADLEKLTPAGDAEPIKAFYQEMTADDSIEIMLTHIRTMQPSHHYLINLFSFPEFMTPTIIEVHEKVLVIFRPYHNNAKILFGWMSNDTFFEFNDTSISHYNISYPRTTFGYLEIQNDPKALLIRTATMRHQYPHHVTAHHTEGHEVFLSYSSGNGATCINHFVRLFIPSAAAINHAITTNNPVTPQAVFSKPNQLYYSEGGKFQKNWVAFEYKTKLLLIERINPMHVMELVADGDGPENAKEVMAEVRTLHKMNKVVYVCIPNINKMCSII